MDHHPDCSDPDSLSQAVPPEPVQEEIRVPLPKPTRLSEVDRLRLENVSLKLMNVGHQLEKLTAARADLSRQFDVLRKECLERYGIDIAITRLDEEGNFQRAQPFHGQIHEPGMMVPA